MGSFIGKVLFHNRNEPNTTMKESNTEFMDMEMTTLENEHIRVKDIVAKNKLTIFVVVASK